MDACALGLRCDILGLCKGARQRISSVFRRCTDQILDERARLNLALMLSCICQLDINFKGGTESRHRGRTTTDDDALSSTGCRLFCWIDLPFPTFWVPPVALSNSAYVADMLFAEFIRYPDHRELAGDTRAIYADCSQSKRKHVGRLR